MSPERGRIPEPEDAELAEPARRADAAEAPPAAILRLQRAAGNAAVARLLGPSAPGATLARKELPAAYQAARDARNAWIVQGVRGPLDYVAGGGGAFGVAYVPDVGNGALNVNVRGAVDFQPGIQLTMAMAAVANQPTAQVKAAATAINQLPLHQRHAAVAAWQWDDAAKATFLAEFESAIESAWGRRFSFHNTRQHWEDLGADVNVIVDVHPAPKLKNDHVTVTTFKIAAGAQAGMVGQMGPEKQDDPYDNTMRLNSTDTKPRTDIPLTVQARFEPGTEKLTGSAIAMLANYATSWKSGGGPICRGCGKEVRELAGTRIWIRVQGDKVAHAVKRYYVVVKQLEAGGMTDADARSLFLYDGKGDTVTFVMGSGQTQVVAAHEAGHLFQLGDEYTGPHGKLGDRTKPGQGAAQGLPEPVIENSDSIMSHGNAVKPQHYATFLEALKRVTGMDDWAFGPPKSVTPPENDAPPQPVHRPR